MQQVRKPGAISLAQLGKIPFINFGEVKNVRSYDKALRQIARRERRGSSALALYDDKGNVHLQVFAPQTSPSVAPQMVFNRTVGKVAVPRTQTGAPIPPGTAPFGNAIESKVLDLIAMVTGQRFRSKRANAPGPDIVNRELAVLNELLEAEVLSPVVEKIVRQGRAAMARWRKEPSTNVSNQVARMKGLNEFARRALQLMPRLTREEIDILLGVFYGLEAATGKIQKRPVPPSLAQFRAAAAQRLRVATS